MNKQMIKDSLILFVITLVAGLLLGGVYELTKNPIAYAKKEKEENAFQEVFADAEFTALGDEEFNEELTAKVLSESGYEKQTIDAAYRASDTKGDLRGYVLVVTSNEAYGGSLQIAMGVQMDGTLNGISFLTLNETTGLGMEAKKPAFYGQFSGKKVERYVYTKSGAASEEEVDALSGATITTNAVTNAVNAGLAYARYLGVDSIGSEDAENMDSVDSDYEDGTIKQTDIENMDAIWAGSGEFKMGGGAR